MSTLSPEAAQARQRPLADAEDAAAMDRRRLFAAFGSFDHQGLPEKEVLLATLDLLDPERVPGIARARQAGDLPAALEAVGRGFARQAPELDGALLVPDTGIEEAERVARHVFTFYGESHQLPEDIDWTHNPGTGHWGHDLNRFGYLVPLVKAFRATGEERFGRKAVELILDWVRKVDTGEAFSRKPNIWTSYLNNAIHCEAWAKALQPLLAAGLVAPEELLLILKSMHDQLAYLQIVTAGHHGNWPTIGCRCILASVAVFPELRDTGRLAAYCRDHLRRQIEEQILPDGVQDELTPHYHRVVIANLLTAARSLRSLGLDLAPETLATLGKMLHYLRQTIVPSGALEVGFNDSDPEVTGGFTSLLDDPVAREVVPDDGPLGPELFPYAGVALLRQREDEGDLYLAFDGGPFGRGHQHEDKLGFVAHAHGHTFIVDPGRHLYDTSEASYRPYLCSTRAHSTIMVGGRGQNSRAHPELYIPTTPDSVAWDEQPGRLRASSRYDLGYGDEGEIRAAHEREIVFAGQRWWAVLDSIAWLDGGSGEELVESRVQFYPGVLETGPGWARMVLGEGENVSGMLLLWPENTPWESWRVEEGQENPRAGWYSPSYNKIRPAPALVLSARRELPLFSAMALVPFPGDSPPETRFSVDGHAATLMIDGERFTVEATR